MKDNEKISYGVLGYNSVNIGDEIQSVAAMRFMPHVDEYPKREDLKNFVPQKGKKTKLIMNAWWMWHPENFIPNEEYIDPLLISMYFRKPLREQYSQGEFREFLIKHGPVGCRDMGTYNWLKQVDIPAYFSGCLSLTLQRNYEIPRQEYILCVDVPKHIVQEIEQQTARPVYDLTRNLLPTISAEKRMELAKLMLRAYHDAYLVISPRFHVIMPSLAMETPVLWLKSKDSSIVADKSRYTGYEKFFNIIDIDSEDYINEIRKFDFENLPPNPNNHLDIRNKLIKTCSDFTGYDNPNSLIDNEPFPFIKLIKLISFSNDNLIRALYMSESEDLIYTLYNKLLGVNKYNLPNTFEDHPNKDLKYKGIIISVLELLVFGIILKMFSRKYTKKIRKSLKEILLSVLLKFQ